MPKRNLNAAGLKEEAEDYQRVTMRFDDSTRIIECRDGIQWVIQTKAPNAERWRGRSYCRTRASLERLLPVHAEAIRQRLPERI